MLDFRNCLLVEQPNGDFARTMVRHLLFSTWQHLLLRELTESVKFVDGRRIVLARSGIYARRQRRPLLEVIVAVGGDGTVNARATTRATASAGIARAAAPAITSCIRAKG